MGHKDAFHDLSMYMWLCILVDIISCSLQMSRLPRSGPARRFANARSITWGDQGFLARRAILRLKIGTHL